MEEKSEQRFHGSRDGRLASLWGEEPDSGNDLVANWLMDAARCGEILACNPSDHWARHEAARISRDISSVLGTRFTYEDDLLHWVGKGNSKRAYCEDPQRQPELRRLAIEITSVSFESDSDARIKRASRALRDFANILDQTIVKVAGSLKTGQLVPSVNTSAHG
jgi:hypothetical protein